jgi:ribonuclease VapC
VSHPVLLDASSLAALVFQEEGCEAVESVLGSSYVTSVNMAELVVVLNRQGSDGASIATDLQAAGLTIVPVAWPHWQGLTKIEALHKETGAKRALSLGDLCCLSYAVQQEMQILTGDRAWADLDLPVPVSLIR